MDARTSAANAIDPIIRKAALAYKPVPQIANSTLDFVGFAVMDKLIEMGWKPPRGA